MPGVEPPAPAGNWSPWFRYPMDRLGEVRRPDSARSNSPVPALSS